MANTNYRAPGSTGVISSQQQISLAPGQRLQAILGVSGTGPDLPTIFTSAAAAYAAYGSPAAGATGTLPYGIQAAMSVSPPGGSPAPLIVCRTGVTRASASVSDIGAKVVFIAQGINSYAGSAGNTLAVVVAAGTETATFKVTVQQGATVLTIYDNLLSGIDFQNKAQGDPNVAIQAGNLTALIPVFGTTALTAGADGLGTVPPGGAIASMLGLLFSGMVPAPRYFTALWDAASVQADVVTALNNAALATPQPYPTMAFLGSAASQTIAQNAATAGSLSGTPNAWMWGNPYGVLFDPFLNAYRALDGFYMAATAMALKAALPPETSLIRQSLPNWVNLGNILAGSSYRPVLLSDVTTLGASGASYGISGPQYSGVEIYDSLTTAPQTGAYAWQSQPGMLDGVYEAMAQAYAIANEFMGEPMPANTDPSNSLASVLFSSLKRLEGNAIAQVVNVSVVAGTTLGQFLPQISILPRTTMRNFDFTFAVSVPTS